MIAPESLPHVLTWDKLNEFEYQAKEILSGQLSAFDAPFRETYEAGIMALPVLSPKGATALDLRCAALFFKRVLNDLRSTWLLLNLGYTSQAASVAASLYENALATVCLTISKENIDKFILSQAGEIPWSPIEMAKMIVRYEGKAPQSKEYENEWRALYAHYVWLCQSKHPTIESVVHDTSASTLESGRYAIVAVPNLHSQDIPLKAMVANIALHRTIECIDAFSFALGYKDQLPQDFRFDEQVKQAKKSALEAFNLHNKATNPISISRSWFLKKYPPIT